MNKVILLLLIASSQVALSQKSIVLKSGDKIDYKSFQIVGNELQVRQPDKSIKTFPTQSVLGTCEEDLILETVSDIEDFKEPQFVKKHYQDHGLGGYKPYVYFHERGKVDVIVFEVSSRLPFMGGTSGTFSAFPNSYSPNIGAGVNVRLSYYAIKDGKVYDLHGKPNLFLYGLFSGGPNSNPNSMGKYSSFGESKRKKEERRIILTDLLADVPEFASILSDSSVNFDGKSALDLIHQYNIKTFVKPEYKKSTTVFLYSSKVEAKGMDMQVSVNDTAPVKFPTTGVLPLQLDALELSKVCIKTDELETCYLIQGSSCGFSYFALKPNNRKKEIVLVSATQKDWDFFQRTRFDK